MSDRPAETADPTRVVHLHIGLHKTGTTFLQNALHANHPALDAAGIWLPGRGVEDQKLAVWDLFGRRPKGAADRRINGRWQELVDQITSSPHRTGLVSEEYLSLATVAQARRAVASLSGRATVHVVVTVRDLGRVLVSAWQEEVKNGATWTWKEFAAAVRDPSARAQNPARGFWLRQDLAAITETWSAVVPPERIHVVTVPPAGAGSELLMERFAGVVGFDPASLTNAPPWSNKTVGPAGTEVLRRLNENLGDRLNQRQYRKVIKAGLVPALGTRLKPPRFALPADHLDWVTERAETLIRAVGERGFPVTGDLADLLPRPEEAVRRPDDASSEELLDATTVALTEVTERYAELWWATRKADPVRPGGWTPGRLRGAVRGTGFRSRRAAADLADRNPAAARLMALYLACRSSASRRAARRRLRA